MYSSCMFATYSQALVVKAGQESSRVKRHGSISKFIGGVTRRGSKLFSPRRGEGDEPCHMNVLYVTLDLTQILIT